MVNFLRVGASPSSANCNRVASENDERTFGFLCTGNRLKKIHFYHC